LDAIWGWVEPKAEAFLANAIGQAAGFLGRLFIAVTIILFVVYYVLTDGERLVTYLKRALPLPDSQVTRMLHEAHSALRAVFFGQIVTSLIQGVLGGIGFLIAGVPGAIIWAAVMAILSLLPVVGAFLVWIPAALYLLVTGDIWQGVFLTAWGFILVSQVDNFVRPKLIGDRADIHPLFVLVGVLGGVAAWGFIGLFLGPLLVGITISVLRVWEAEYLDPALIESLVGPAAGTDPAAAAGPQSTDD
jgi:predicted PurR-regulated permease PerM